MLQLLGMIMVVVCILGSYTLMGGKLYVLNQPFEFVIIAGSGFFAFMIGNRPAILKLSIKRLMSVFRGPKYKKDDYLEILLMQYQVYRLIKQRGALALEQHLEKPNESPLFNSFPKFCENEEALTFYTDYLRMISLGTDNAMQVETLLIEDLKEIESEEQLTLQSLFTLSDSFPALGIVAAVLGVIKTMSSITEPPEVLGNLIAGALVGTFLGVLLCYGWFAPLSSGAKQVYEEERTYMQCLKSGILAYLQGHAPVVCLEFARKSLAVHNRPSFNELEDAVAGLAPPAQGPQ